MLFSGPHVKKNPKKQQTPPQKKKQQQKTWTIQTFALFQTVKQVGNESGSARVGSVYLFSSLFLKQIAVNIYKYVR